MHELSITKKIIEMIEKECSKNNIKKPDKIHAEIGELTTYKKEPIKYYFDILKKENHLLKKADIDMKIINGKIKCKDCKKENHIKEKYLILCPECGSGNIDILDGEDIRLKQIEGE
ncbi:hypothetical protein GF327_00705 [Candidatus Woesearchaeota archaeon]|nr:hypothetical protein [Candidatus Woesearchaeota archaeon]